MTAAGDVMTNEVRAAREQARLVIRHYFGSKPRRISHEASGLSNFVFSVGHPEGDFIVRLSPEPAKINDFIKEQWAQARAREIGVPTPEILEVGNEVVPLPYMISRTVSGHVATFSRARLQILHEMGRYAALINQIPTTGFGGTFDWSSNQLSRNETWGDYLRKDLQFEARLDFLAKQRMLSPKKLKRLQEIFAAAVKQNPRPALNHGDVRLKNVIVDDEGQITAILDWEHCTSNLAPHWELSLALHDLAIDEKQKFLEGYGLTEKKIIEFVPLIKALNIINYAPEVERLAELKDDAALEQYRTRLSGALDLYSLHDADK